MKGEEFGFEYHLEDEVIERYRKKPLELRLMWLYMGNLFRKACPEETIALQDGFRKFPEKGST